MKKKFKLKPSKNNLLNKLKAPFLNIKNYFVVGGILLLFSFFLVIAFSSFFINWKADNSLVLDASFSDIITNDENFFHFRLKNKRNLDRKTINLLRNKEISAIIN